ncbi:AraC family transcriptional regulator [Pseudomaricurvus alkylphenolicus]|uniref:AraC family transcriptional regulator n=1 Tax=Pseudomaricurvus alkylphenolicus TaxID=1306991 RepID=UPI00141F5345|nr:AraC family transcriptional regulator [Pseudomaricurvus alkylphenolicus]NIB38302.1 AraC family transcriptional regulator [Pseudomaricurvus alkylphenolicus]
MRFDQSLQRKLLYPSIPVGFLNDVLAAAQHRGLPVEQLLLNQGLSLNQLNIAGFRVSVDQYSQVVKQLGEHTDDAFLGFLSRPVPIRAFSVFCYSVVGCRNMQEVIDQANHFYALFTDDFHWSLQEEQNELLLSIQIKPLLPLDYRFVIQSLLLMTIRLLGWLLGEDLEPREVDFTFSKNNTDENLTYLFGNKIHYGCESNSVRFDRRIGDAKLSCTRDQVSQLLKNTRHLFLVSRLKNPLSQEVRRLLLMNKSQEWLEVEEVAELLGLNKNLLWRKLKKEGTSFLEIRDHIKRDWSLTLLEDPGKTVEQVADQLRYSDVSAFRKAFKKWTGLQPVQYRREIKVDG